MTRSAPRQSPCIWESFRERGASWRFGPSRPSHQAAYHEQTARSPVLKGLARQLRCRHARKALRKWRRQDAFLVTTTAGSNLPTRFEVRPLEPPKLVGGIDTAAGSLAARSSRPTDPVSLDDSKVISLGARVRGSSKSQ